MNDDTTPTSGDSSDAGDAGDPATRSGGAGSSAGATVAGGRRRKRSGFVRRHWVLVSIAVVLVLLVGSAAGYLYWFNSQLNNISRVHVATLETDPQPGGSQEKKRALNILLLGADAGTNEQSVSDDLKDGKWTPFLHRSDTLMIAHIPADRKSVQLVSIPRDTWVPIEGYPSSGGYGKINAAFAFGGPDVAAKTVEHLTGITIDHLAIIDWAGFKDLTTALDGVRVYIPQTFYDDSQLITWEKGWHTFKGQEALAYVRTRHGLDDGDFDRIARQQNFLRATMSKLLSRTHNIVSMTKVIKVVTRYLTIDSGWDNGELIDLALSLRDVKETDVQFLTAPLGRYDTAPDGQSIVRLNPKRSRLLFTDVKSDNVADYLDKFPKAELRGTKSVS
ncbi:MAG: LCP family protein [Propionibacteriales bacterium]|nr:LCP family protein [Propionibacteriales bacterium]